MRIQRRAFKKARIEIIPMIDTIFFLLVFFMISTLSMVHYRSFPVNLPKAASGQEPPAQILSIALTKEGRIFLEKQEVTSDQIRPLFQHRLTNNPGLVLIIDADHQAEHGWVVEIMDQARQAGVAKIAIAVRPKEK